MPGTCPRCATPVPAAARFCSVCGSPASPRSPIANQPGAGGPPPVLPPRYEIVRFLGRGGMGRVYLCHDAELDVDVAVKVLPPEAAAEDEALEQIRREARAAARFRGHPGLLALYGFETFADSSYLVMEYAAGGSLHDLLRRERRLPEAECRRIGAEVADALAFAHSRNVLHRDIKPANVLLDAGMHVRVADFGIAKVLTDTSARLSQFTQAGTPDYMAPEIIQGLRPDGRADLFSLGVMLYQMAVGERPYRGSEGIAARIATGAVPPDPRAARPDLSEEFSAVVWRLLQRDPAMRLPDAAACAAALRAPVAAPPPGDATPTLTVDGFGVSGARRGTSPSADGSGPSRTAVAIWSAAALAAIGGALLAMGGDDDSRRDGSPEPGDTSVRAAAAATDSGHEGDSPRLPPQAATTGAAGPPPDGGVPHPTAATPPGDPPPDPGSSPAAPEPPPGLLVRTEPPGAMVTVDGRERGIAGEDGLLLTDLAPGATVTVKAWLADHAPAEAADVRWNPGDRREVRLSLARLSGLLHLVGGPPGATVRMDRGDAPPLEFQLGDDGELGPTPVEAGRWRALVSKPGHEPRSVDVLIESGRTARVDVALTERDGTVAVSSDPPGAEIHVDGSPTPIARTPSGPLRLRPGRHTLRLVHPERGDVTLDVEIRGDAGLDLGTIPLPPLATLDLTGIAADVAATVDGAVVSGLVRRPEGEVRVVLSRPGFRDQAFEVTLLPGQQVPVTPGPWVPLPGAIDLSALPADVTVTVDGRPVARAGGPVEVAPGEHTVALRRPGYRPVPDRRVSVAAGSTTRIDDPTWTALTPTITPAVPGLPPPPEDVLAAQRALAAIPDGLVRDATGRLWCVKDGAEMVLIPAGEFVMGATEGDGAAQDDEKPAHRVFVSAFLMDRHEITNAQFARFVKETGHRTKAEKTGKDWTLSGGEWKEVDGADWRRPEGPGSTIKGRDHHPVVLVSWNDAAAYCEWAGRRLPTEAEFEKALRGGVAGQVYPWGNADVPPAGTGNYADATFQRAAPRYIAIKGYDDGHARTAPAGAFAPNAFGLFDISGNVWEWCADWYDARHYASRGRGVTRDPKGPETGSFRVARGGGWSSHSLTLRSADRGRSGPPLRNDALGCRAARGLP